MPELTETPKLPACGVAVCCDSGRAGPDLGLEAVLLFYFMDNLYQALLTDLPSDLGKLCNSVTPGLLWFPLPQTL